MARQEHIANARAVFRDTLALFVGQGRRFSVEAVAAAAEMSPDSIRAALRGQSCPDWCNAMALLDVLPAEFAASVLRPAGIAGVRKIDSETTPAETLREIAEAAAALAAALADGRIDHTELPIVTKELTEAMVSISTMLASLTKGSAA